jgi:hypothetical protein
VLFHTQSIFGVRAIQATERSRSAAKAAEATNKEEDRKTNGEAREESGFALAEELSES